MSDPTRIVADADVLAADLLCGGAPRQALDPVFEHSWLTLVASEALLDDATATIRSLSDGDLATDWRDLIGAECEIVDHPAGDHPGLASAYRGEAAHLLTLEEGLASARAGLSIQPHANLSIRQPSAFAAVFDAAALYEATHDDAYSGPDRDSRA